MTQFPGDQTIKRLKADMAFARRTAAISDTRLQVCYEQAAKPFSRIPAKLLKCTLAG